MNRRKFHEVYCEIIKGTLANLQLQCIKQLNLQCMPFEAAKECPRVFNHVPLCGALAFSQREFLQYSWQ